MLEAFRAFRAAEPARIVTLAVEPGAGHFAWSDRNGRLAALFIRKAAQAIGRRLDHTAGWLTDSDLKQPQAPPAPYVEFTGDAATANWHFDREMAEAVVAYHRGLTGKRDQFLRWKNPYWVDAGTRYFFHNIAWVGDGQTFEVEPAYADTYPTPQPGGGPRWALAGQPAGHSTTPIRVRPVSGPIEAVGSNRLRFRFDSVAAVSDGYRATFLAYSDGDADYRYTELVGMLPRGFKGLTEGKDQTITFPPLPDVKATGDIIELQATSDAGLPVEYYVAWGPAAVQDGRLRITEIPARARYPIEVKVVAWQFGRGLDPRVKTAAPVERTFWIRAP
jgi:hypothetical protein